MLPSPHELRELSERMRAAVPKARTDEMKQRLAGDAFRLAQIAEQLERDEGAAAFVRRANIERYERMLAGALDEKTRQTVEALLAEENADWANSVPALPRGGSGPRNCARAPTSSRMHPRETRCAGPRIITTGWRTTPRRY